MSRRIFSPEELAARVKARRERNLEPTHIGQDYSYIVTKQDGRMVLLGPYNDDREAGSIAMEKIIGDYEIVQMSTRDRAKATQMLRHKLLKGDGGDLSVVLRRMRHTI